MQRYVFVAFDTLRGCGNDVLKTLLLRLNVFSFLYIFFCGFSSFFLVSDSQRVASFLLLKLQSNSYKDIAQISYCEQKLHFKRRNKIIIFHTFVKKWFFFQYPIGQEIFSTKKRITKSNFFLRTALSGRVIPS